MKKSLFLILFIFISFICKSQMIEKEIKLDSRTLKQGGTYILIPSVSGKAIVLDEMNLKYKPKTTIYTIASTDSIKIVTSSPNIEEDYLVILSDSIFVQESPFVSKSKIVSDVFYTNNISIELPTSKLTLGDGELYIKFKYELY